MFFFLVYGHPVVAAPFVGSIHYGFTFSFLE